MCGTSLRNMFSLWLTCTSMVYSWSGYVAQAQRHVELAQDEECPVFDGYYEMELQLDHDGCEEVCSDDCQIFCTALTLRGPWQECQQACREQDGCVAWRYEYRTAGQDDGNFVCNFGSAVAANSTIVSQDGSVGCRTNSCSEASFCDGSESNADANGGDLSAHARTPANVASLFLTTLFIQL